MTTNQASTYDELFFESRPSPERHIGRLSVIANLFGIDPPPLSNCKVLEIGCSTGANLIPQALAFPDSYFLGIDLAHKQVETGLRTIDQLALKNIKLQSVDILDYSAYEEKYDYIICNGLFSWVAPIVQDNILSLCQEALSENGIVYLSFNCLPGWLIRSTIQKALLVNDDNAADSPKRIKAAREHMTIMISQLGEATSLYSVQLREELNACLQNSDSFILHELLEESCEAYYLNDFVERVSDYNLQYLGDSQPTRMRFLSYEDLLEMVEGCEVSLEAKEGLQHENKVKKEQIIDFMAPLSFRGALLCRDNVHTEDGLSTQVVSSLYVASPLVPLDDLIKVHETKTEVFCGPGEITIDVVSPLIKAAFLYLRSVWPEAVPFSELAKGAWEIIASGEIGEKDRLDLQRNLIECFQKNLVNFYMQALDCSYLINDIPMVCPFARYQALEKPWVTSLCHEYFPLNEFDQFLIRFVDGTRDVEQIEQKMYDLVKGAKLCPSIEGQAVSDPEKLKSLVHEQVKSSLKGFAEGGLLANEAYAERYIDLSSVDEPEKKGSILSKIASLIR